ncbi:gp53-like domain-containing protein, partial [Pseudomonas aeruginosa]|uniref:gp53-like domain-containing protein n=1 Tax=Pseudomonas aeruginosa TaxID=287 RepID=UPI003F884C51
SCQSGMWMPNFDFAQIGNPGYTRLPSGLILQFGSFGSYSATGYSGALPQKIIFKTPFPHACIMAQGTHSMGYGQATAAVYAAVVNCDAEGIQFAATVPGRHWFAIGY